MTGKSNSYEFDFKKYFEKNYDNECRHIIINNDKIKNIVDKIIDEKKVLNIDIQNREKKSNISFLSNDKFKFKNLKDIHDYFVSNNKDLKRGLHKPDDLSYYVIENENFIIVINNFYLNKKYMDKKYRNSLHRENETNKKSFKFFSSKDKIEEIHLKLNFLLSVAESSDEIFSNMSGFILNDKNLYYCLVIDKKEPRNTFVIFKNYYLKKSTNYYKRESLFFDAHIIFPAKLEDEKNIEYNYISLKNFMFNDNYNKFMKKITSVYGIVTFLNLDKIVNFNFNYFDVIDILTLMTKMIYFGNINEFNFGDLKNVVMIKLNKRENDYKYGFSDEEYSYLMKKDDKKYVRYFVEKDLKRNFYRIDITSGYFNFEKSNYFISNDKHIMNHLHHDIFGPSKIYLAYRENKPDYENISNNYAFYIDGICYDIYQYIEKISNIVGEKEMMKFMIKYLK